MIRQLFLLVVIVCLFVTPATGEVTQNSGVTGFSGSDIHTTIIVSVSDDGDARWTIRMSRQLYSPDAVENFREYQDREFTPARDNHSTRFRNRMLAVVKQANRYVEREMVISDFHSETRIENEDSVGYASGVVEYSFTWEQFGNPAGVGVEVGDALRGSVVLGKSQTLILIGPNNTVVREVIPLEQVSRGYGSINASAPHILKWEGTTKLRNGFPHVRFVIEDAAVESRNDGVDIGSHIVLTGLIILTLVAVGVAWREQRQL